MNTPLRRVAIALMVLFAALLINANVIQVGEAGGLKNNPHNARMIISTYDHQRGPIVVAGKPVAQSVPTKDTLKYLRTYPGGSTYAAATGFFSIVYGASAVEQAENQVLAGTDNRFFLRRLTDKIEGRTPQGGTVELTLNPAAQQTAVNQLAGRRGAVVALDPRTGAILALATSPSYDPSVLSSHDTAAIRSAWAKLNADPAHPLLDRAISDRYPPGSTFKVITAAAALSSGKYTPQTMIPAPDTLTLPQTTKTLGNFAGETCGSGGQISLRDALRISCNTAFGQLGLSLGDCANTTNFSHCSADPIRKQAEAFGFGRTDLTIPMPVVASVVSPNPPPPQVAYTAIGQFDDAMTPLQGAMVAAGVANNGTVMKPYLVSQVTSADLSTVDKTRPQQLSQAVSPQVAGELKSMMAAVVADGTGTAAQIPGVTVAGKTGTAQKGVGALPDVWFIAFAPAEHPTVAVCVYLADGGGQTGTQAQGGVVAAPVAKAVMQAVLKSGTPP